MENKTYYKQSVTIFAIVVPLVLAALLVGVLFFMQSSIKKKLSAKKADHKKELLLKTEIQSLTKKVQGQKKSLEAWTQLDEGEPLPKFSSLLEEIEGMIPKSEFRQTSFKKSGEGYQLGDFADLNSVNVTMGYQGSVKGLQEGLFRLEMDMPSVFLTSIDLSSQKGTPIILSEINYSILSK